MVGTDRRIAFQAVSADKHLACRMNDNANKERQAGSPLAESGRDA
jgi:hypothetical protein